MNNLLEKMLQISQIFFLISKIIFSKINTAGINLKLNINDKQARLK